MAATSKDAYSQAGVDYSLMDAWKLNAQAAGARTASHLRHHGITEIEESRGESAYIIDTGQALIATVTEGLGTKHLVADATRPITGRSHYDQVAVDVVAAILNDLATVGAKPLVITAFWAAGSSDWFADQVRMNDLVRGWEQACAVARCSWGGGETQALAGVIEPSTVTLAGSAMGLIADRRHLLGGSRIQPGDAILVAPASGIHTNGLTLVRKLVDGLPERYATRVTGDAGGRSVGEVLLDPSPLYGPLVEALQTEVDLHYAVNVTGHGWRKLMRADRELSYVVERLPPVLPIFESLRAWSKLDDASLYGTFNMGGGFALFVPERDAAQAISLARAAGHELLAAGHVEAGARRVILEPIGVEFGGDTLGIR